MRVAMIVVVIALASSPAFSPSLASPSCMTQSEARAKFPREHLWWHGPNRCWDATPPSRARLAQRNKAREAKQAEREVTAEPEAAEEKKPSRWASDNRWRDAMSKASPADLAGMTAPARAQAGIEPADTTAAPRIDWRERWVDITQRMPPATDRAGPADLAADAGRAEPIVTPVRVMLALLVLLLALGAFELMRRPARKSWRD